MSHLLFPLPTTAADVVRAELRDYYKTPDSNPIVRVVRYQRTMQDVRDEAHTKQERRKFLAVPETPTSFGGLT